MIGSSVQFLRTPGYREKASHFRRVTADAHGLAIAAKVIEDAFQQKVLTP